MWVEIKRDELVISREEYFSLKDEVKRLKKLVKIHQNRFTQGKYKWGKIDMRCNYCLKEGSKKDLRVVTLRCGRNTWSAPLLVCKLCRKHLFGVFKYVTPQHSSKSK